MAVDRYTKLLLTVIAACLVWMTIGGSYFEKPVVAQSSDRVILAGWVDEQGAVRPFPAVFRGDTPGSRPLPIWMMNK